MRFHIVSIFALHPLRYFSLGAVDIFIPSRLKLRYLTMQNISSIYALLFPSNSVFDFLNRLFLTCGETDSLLSFFPQKIFFLAKRNGLF